MTGGLRLAAAIVLGLVLAALPFLHFGVGFENHHTSAPHDHVHAHDHADHHVATGE